ncbi:Cobalt-zinc-cadmium resistance protein [uncultured Gammaproteobacteria bacterium]|uniref:cation diffusion facilitator family transporter n=1 Tax=Bathymodiolus heckerae thiotrophic gill symbiont TaxID=1052212 RepID=UPI0010AEFCCF|nr:cation diffusion facilitator family transporter [Bathymodiolus heckerae thiotrophic gill symbiont]CAC9536413.1 Cobalt-zinc-cadmium resistance protein [uncultured Gammaproteobacteria bacterium]CAC9952216.1 Cobalt-zinc-cadmium resistance protein [uncultured Gammaproteobacteria bacterium]CAC9961514.1 Cobalt-zinc-cadmium resistance protein [uncultured Gammaproteobacteria bacterium]SHN89268.1 Cobalt-zinc-cadmium resistance protein [Bathymodiolus heckerae thiotrophic gill symbiont]
MIFETVNPTSRTKATQKITIIGAIVDLSLAILKIIAGVIGNSGALIADGIHSFSDLLSDGIVLYAAKHSQEDADEDHPYGHQKFETVATLGLAVILALVGVGIIFDGFDRLNNPAALTHINLLLGVAGISIFTKEMLYWYTLKIAKTYNSDMLKANAWHHRSDALSSVVVFAGVLGTTLGFIYLDAVAAIVVGLMVTYIAWELGTNATKELVDTSIDTDQIEKLRYALGQISGVNNVHSLRTRKIGHTISADVHVQVDPFLSVSEGHMISVSVERVAKECLENLTDVTVHIDPEDDEMIAPFKNLPERAEALGILTKALFNNKCDGEIDRIQLHYLDGKIHVDFYLPLSCLVDDKSHQEILIKLKQTVENLVVFGHIKVYFGND